MSVSVETKPTPASFHPKFRQVAMSRADYELLPEKPKAEWCRGVATIMMAPVAHPHGISAARLITLLSNNLENVEVATEVGFRMIDSDRAPDVMVTPAGYDGGAWVTEPPLLLAEVVSLGTRATDYVIKAGEYAAAGVGQYWIIDSSKRVINILSNNGKGGWDPLIELNDETPTAEVEVPGHGTVPVDLNQLL
jgi:Uma2 family endonuclease